MNKNKKLTRIDLVQEIKAVLLEYKQELDEFEADYSVRKFKLDKKYEDDLEKFKPEYAEEMRKTSENEMNKLFKDTIKERQEKAKAKMDFYFDRIRSGFDTFFNAPCNEDFMRKISMYDALGIQPNRYEIENLKKSVTNYTEMRIFQGFVDKVIKDDTTGNWGDFVDSEAFRIDIPDISEIYDELRHFEAVSYHALGYSGCDSRLMDLVAENPNDMGEVGMLASAGTFYIEDCKVVDDYIETLQKAESIVPTGKTSLTEIETDFLDSLFGEDFNITLESKIPKVAKASGEMRELIELHPTYSKFLGV